ncbi:MAG TPA: hypothetical protein VKA25_06060, partial [Gemmatimonadales bacterium]|nr:hypothetical protein [Gemmatimonadales bacterium]
MLIAHRSPAYLWLFILLIQAAAGSLDAQSQKQDYDDVDPWVGVTPLERGPDSSAVVAFLKSLSSTDPVICQFVVHSIGNNWGHWHGDYATGNLK